MNPNLWYIARLVTRQELGESFWLKVEPEYGMGAARLLASADSEEELATGLERLSVYLRQMAREVRG